MPWSFGFFLFSNFKLKSAYGLPTSIQNSGKKGLKPFLPCSKKKMAGERERGKERGGREEGGEGKRNPNAIPIPRERGEGERGEGEGERLHIEK